MSDFSHIEPDEPRIEAEFLGNISAQDRLLGGNGDGSTMDSLLSNAYTEDKETPTEEAPFGDSTTQVGDGACVVCGAPVFRPPGLTATGRKKRVPRYCDLHAPNRQIQGERPSFTGVESQLQKIQDELADDLRLLGTLSGPLLPTTGYYLIQQADPFTIALVKLCKNNQRMLRVLHRAAQVAPVYTIAETMAGVGYAVQVDQQKADPHNVVAQRLGVEKAYNAVHPDESNVVSNNISSFTPPPRYAAAAR